MSANSELMVPDACDPNIEELVLGNILQSPNRLRDILNDISLVPEAFYLRKTRAVYSQILALHHEGTLPEIHQVQSRLNGDCPDNYAHYLINISRAIDLSAYAKRLVELYQWRKRQEITLKQLDSIKKRDIEAYTRYKALSEVDEVDQSSYYPPERLASEFLTYLSSDGIEAFELPFPRLNRSLGGGLRRKQFSVIGGWSGFGKSVVTDQILTHVAKQGHRVHLYMNEMGHEERTARLLSSSTNINTTKIMGGDLNTDQRTKVMKALPNIPFSITPCAGWSVEELTFDIRNKEYDLIGVDIIHQFDYDSESELARISRLLTRVAKQANCHVLGTVHLNEFRAKESIKPRPVMRDIRGSGMLQRDPDNVFFIHREQDPYSGDPLMPAIMYASKVRNGSLGHQDLMFNPTNMSFENG